MAGILLSIGIWLFGKKRFIYIWLALGIIWLYAVLTGLHPPVVRGAIMASLFLSAELLGRQRTAITSLAFAAAVMVGIDPPILFDAAFQLSFLAIAGLIFITPPLRELGSRAVKATLGEKGVAVSLANIVSDGFSVTLAAVIAVWPLIAHYFRRRLPGRAFSHFLSHAGATVHHRYRGGGGAGGAVFHTPRPGHRLDCLAV